MSLTLFATKSVSDRPNISEGTCTLQGHAVKLRCDVFLYDESPTLTDVYWTKDGIKLNIGGSGGKFLGVDVNNQSLIINNVNYNDAGDYKLIAINAVGETRSKGIVLGNILRFQVFVNIFRFIRLIRLVFIHGIRGARRMRVIHFAYMGHQSIAG